MGVCGLYARCSCLSSGSLRANSTHAQSGHAWRWDAPLYPHPLPLSRRERGDQRAQRDACATRQTRRSCARKRRAGAARGSSRRGCAGCARGFGPPLNLRQGEAKWRGCDLVLRMYEHTQGCKNSGHACTLMMARFPSFTCEPPGGRMRFGGRPGGVRPCLPLRLQRSTPPAPRLLSLVSALPQHTTQSLQFDDHALTYDAINLSD